MQATNDPAAEIYGASITRPRRNGIGGRVVGQAADRTACTVNHIDFCLSGLVGLEGDPLPIRRPAGMKIVIRAECHFVRFAPRDGQDVQMVVLVRGAAAR